ncbi:hypothetical protein B1B_09040, partial [mine drainage metagenome]
LGPALLTLTAGERRRLPRQLRLRPRRIVTTFGEILLQRCRYAQDRGPSIHPLDEQLQLPLRSYSYEVQKRLIKRAVQGPFQEAIEGLREEAGVTIPKRSAQEILIDTS